LSGDSLGVVGEFLLAELDMLFDAVSEAAGAARDVADDAVLARVERESFQSVVFHVTSDDLNNVAVDRLDEAVVVTTVRHRHQNLQQHEYL